MLGVRRRVSQENARLTNECGANCTAEDFRRIDQQMAKLESAGTLAEIGKRSTLTPEQANNLAQLAIDLAPGYGSGESLMQAMTGRSSVSDEEVSRFWAAVGVVPVAGGVLRRVGEPAVDALRGLFAGGDAASKLVRGAENVASFKSLNDARASARELSGLSDDAVDFVQEIGPLKGQVTGRMSPDGLRGWRIDFDPNKGFHVNWWDRSAGMSRSDWIYGANKIEGGTLDQFHQTLQHFPKR